MFIEFMENKGYSWNDFDYCYEMESLIKEYADMKSAEKESNDVHSLLGDGWRDVRKELPVTPFLAYWTDERITIIEDGDSVSYALTGDPDKRVIAWMSLSEIGKPAFA